MTAIVAKPNQHLSFDCTAQPVFQPDDQLQIDDGRHQAPLQDNEVSVEDDDLFSISRAQYRETGATQPRQSQIFRQQPRAQQYYQQSLAGPVATRITSPAVRTRAPRHHSLPNQQQQQGHIIPNVLNEPSSSAFTTVNYSPVTYTSKRFRNDFELSSQDVEEYSSAHDGIGSSAVVSSVNAGQSSRSDIVARDGQHGQNAIAMQYPYPAVLPTTEQYQQHQVQQEQHTLQRQRNKQIRQLSHEQQQQQQQQQQHHRHHHGQHGYRLPDRSPPTKVSRHDSDQTGLRHVSLGTSSLVGQEGMPQPALRPKGPKLKFTTEDDQLLVDLKEKNNLTWKQIAEFFPGRSSGTLQVRYCTKLKAKDTVWTEETVSSGSMRKTSFNSFTSIKHHTGASRKPHYLPSAIATLLITVSPSLIDIPTVAKASECHERLRVRQMADCVGEGRKWVLGRCMQSQGC